MITKYGYIARVLFPYKTLLKSDKAAVMNDAPQQPPSEREQMIQRLIENKRNNALADVSKYEIQVRQWDDDKLAREYKIEFGK